MKDGITLIALIITIIVLLILSLVTIQSLSGNDSAPQKATEAAQKDAISGARDQIAMEVSESLLKHYDGTSTEDTTMQELVQGAAVTALESAKKNNKLLIDPTGVSGNKITLKTSSYTVTGTIEENGGITWGDTVASTDKSTGDKYVSVKDIFQNLAEGENGYDPNKLHIGDFVNYTAGNWTEDDMNKIANSGAKIPANNSSNAPTTTAFEFGGFTEGSSKDGNATPYDSASCTYVKDEKDQPITGWRVFDVDENTGTITLISAGCPEDYYHKYETNYAYISEYILTGKINGSTPEEIKQKLETTYIPRDWSMYVNESLGARSATVLTKEKLENWYSRYMNLEIDNIFTINDERFKAIYSTKYETMIDNYFNYWLSSVCDSFSLYYMRPEDGGNINGYGTRDAFGVRILVSLNSGVQISEENAGTKTVKNPRYGTSYYKGPESWTYNVWNLKIQ